MCVRHTHTKYHTKFNVHCFIQEALQGHEHRTNKDKRSEDKIGCLSKTDCQQLIALTGVSNVSNGSQRGYPSLNCGGSVLLTILTALFNALCYIPAPFRHMHGLIIPIPKGHNKDLSKPTNFTAITILSMFGKVFSKVFFHHLSDLQCQLNSQILNQVTDVYTWSLFCKSSLSESSRSLKEGIGHSRACGPDD